MSTEPGNKGRGRFTAAGIHIPERREILERDGRVVRTGGCLCDKQGSGIHKVSRERGMAVVGLRTPVSERPSDRGSGCVGERAESICGRLKR
jgi:hypothetical protein